MRPGVSRRIHRSIPGRRFVVIDEERQLAFGFFIRIKDGQIRKVEALMVSLPYGQKNPYVPQQ